MQRDERSWKEDNIFFALISLVLGIIFLVSVLLRALLFDNTYVCTTDDDCDYEGTCNHATGRCVCTQYAQYPGCNPAYAHVFGWGSFFALTAIAALCIWIVSAFAYLLHREKRLYLAERVDELTALVKQSQSKGQ